jgi:hypothetical protein
LSINRSSLPTDLVFAVMMIDVMLADGFADGVKEIHVPNSKNLRAIVFARESRAPAIRPGNVFAHGDVSHRQQIAQRPASPGRECQSADFSVLREILAAR